MSQPKPTVLGDAFTGTLYPSPTEAIRAKVTAASVSEMKPQGVVS